MNSISKDDARWLEVGPEAEHQRLDNFLLKTLKGVPRSHVYRLIRSGEVRVDSRRVGASHKLSAGERLRLPPVRCATPPAQRTVPAYLPEVVYEDDALLVIDKPSGLAAHGGSGVSFGVIEQLRAGGNYPFLELVHRLDRDTSGLLMLAKKRSALTALHADLREGRVRKRYLAWVFGDYPATPQRIELRLYKYLTAQGERRVRVTPDGQDATTLVRREGAAAGASRVEAELLTGRTHQIRVHLAHTGFPVVNDEKYGDFAMNRTFAKDTGVHRLLLHAHRLELTHPLTKLPLSLASPCPPGFNAPAGIPGAPAGIRDAKASARPGPADAAAPPPGYAR